MAVTFDAVSAGQGGVGTVRTVSHTIAGNAILAFVNLEVSGSSPGATATVGGQAMTQLAALNYWNNAGFAHYLYVFGKLSPLTGAQNVVATLGASGAARIDTMSYNGVSSFGTVVTNSGLASPTVTVPSAAGQMVAAGFSGDDAGNGFSAFTQTLRKNTPFTSGANVSIMVGDAAGSASVVLAATTVGRWGGVGVPLIAAGGSSQGNFFALL